MPIPLQDVLEIKPLNFYDAEFELQIAGNKIEGDAADNLVVRVFLELKHEFNLPPQTIYLYKRIPTGAGLGGGSSDAAFMMRMLNENFKLGLTADDMEQRLSHIGADCPFFVRNTPSYATGIGDVLHPFELDLSSLHLLLVKPSLSVPTRDAYAHIVPAQPEVDLREALQSPIETWKDTVVNDFERSVFEKFPQIAAIKQTLYDMHALYASMSGSGSAVFGIFQHPFEDVDKIFKDCFVMQKPFVVYPSTFS